MDSKPIFAGVKLAYIFYDDGGPLSADREHYVLLQFLQEKGLDIHKEEWTDKTVDWRQYQCIVLKSPWDYVAKTELFYEWLDKMKQLNIPMLNNADIVKWNSNKHYLLDIERAGLKIIPTTFLEKGTVFEYSGPSDLIVKPCISGASQNTFKISSGSDLHAINKLLQQQAMMVQPFMQQVNEEGEWSLVFLGGRFSHALVKTPAKEDFRSQPQFGGVVQGKKPPERLLESATRYVTEFAKGCLYARVDGLIIDGEFHLMELELIDPYLFLATYPAAYEHYYIAVCKECLHYC